MTGLPEAAARNLAAVREKKPLIHNITNFVVMPKNRRRSPAPCSP